MISLTYNSLQVDTGVSWKASATGHVAGKYYWERERTGEVNCAIDYPRMPFYFLFRNGDVSGFRL